MARGEATHITKYSLAVETKHENDHLIAVLREVGNCGNAIKWTARHSDESKPRNAKLSFWCDIKLGNQKTTLSESTDALSQAFVGALNSAKDTWVERIIVELEKESHAAVEAAIGEINWLKENFDA